MKHSINIMVFTAAVFAASSCAVIRQADDRKVTADPSGYVLTPDQNDSVRLEMNFNIPGKYLSSRARLVITPELVTGGYTRERFEPIVADAPIYARKMNRKEVLESYEDPYKDIRTSAEGFRSGFVMPYTRTVHIPEDVRTARIRAVISGDGCAECSAVDTVEIASVTTPLELEENFRTAWMEPQFVIRPKIREGKGEAHLQFVINKSDIRPEMGNNRAELDSMLAVLAPVMNDTLATVNSLSIYGMASADGSYSFNAALARNRADAAMKWLLEHVDVKPAVKKITRVGSKPEGWWPVYEAMKSDGHPDTLEVKRILETYTDGNDDVQERYIRRLACWQDIKTKYLQKDRKVEYTYSYTVRSFTRDAELLEMYSRRPDAFNEEEFLRVASLASGVESRMKDVYGAIQRYFPDSQTAANNLAVICLGHEDVAGALEALSPLDEYSPETMNTLGVCHVKNGNVSQAAELFGKSDTEQSRYNLGLLTARSGDMEKAYQLLAPYRDLNSAIAALNTGRTAEADGIMQELDIQSPVAEYVRSLISARNGQAEDLFGHLARACADPELKARAADEADFAPYREDMRFVEAIK